jgi:hypothetical protein
MIPSSYKAPPRLCVALAMSLFGHHSDMDTTKDRHDDNDTAHLRASTHNQTLRRAHYAQQLCAEALEKLNIERAYVVQLENDNRFTHTPGDHNPFPEERHITVEVIINWKRSFMFGDGRSIYARPAWNVGNLITLIIKARTDIELMTTDMTPPTTNAGTDDDILHYHTIQASERLDGIIDSIKEIINTSVQNTQHIRDALEAVEELEELEELN